MHKKLIRLISFLLIVCFITSLCGCSNNNDMNSNGVAKSSVLQESRIAEETTKKDYTEEWKSTMKKFSIEALSYNVMLLEESLINSTVAKNDNSGKVTIVTFRISWTGENTDYSLGGIDFLDKNGKKLTYDIVSNAYDFHEDHETFKAVKFVGDINLKDITARLKNVNDKSIYVDFNFDKPVNFNYNDKNIINIEGRPYLSWMNDQKGDYLYIDNSKDRKRVIINYIVLIPLDSNPKKTLTEKDCTLKKGSNLTNEFNMEVFIDQGEKYELPYGNKDGSTIINLETSYIVKETDIDNEKVIKATDNKLDDIVKDTVLEFSGANGPVTLMFTDFEWG